MTQTTNLEQFAGQDPAVLAWTEAFATRQEPTEATAEKIGTFLLDVA